MIKKTINFIWNYGRRILKEHRRIDKGIEQYVFSLKEHGLDFDLNITVLVENKSALLIDVGYPDQGAYVKEALDKRGIVVKKIILSHYHPDHAGGMMAFPEATIVASKNWKTNYGNCIKWAPEVAYREVDYSIFSGEYLRFGSFRLQCFETPGHSVCGLSIMINDAFLHVGDLIMNDERERPALPLICKDGDLYAHIKSLDWLDGFADKIIILPHGKSLMTNHVIREAIKIRRSYLNSLVEAYELWHDEDYREKYLAEWSEKEWHTINMKAAKYLVL